ASASNSRGHPRARSSACDLSSCARSLLENAKPHSALTNATACRLQDEQRATAPLRIESDWRSFHQSIPLVRERHPSAAALAIDDSRLEKPLRRARCVPCTP